MVRAVSRRGPALQRFYERQAGDDFEIVGIDTQETAEAGRGFVEEFGLTYPQLHDGAGEYADELKTKGVPENFLVDPEGDVALVHAGPVTEEFLETQVAPMIEGLRVRLAAALAALLALALPAAAAAGGRRPRSPTSRTR